MAEGGISGSWCVVDRTGIAEDGAVEVAEETLTGRDSPDQNGEAPISLLLAGETDSSGLPSPVATPSDGLEMSDSDSSSSEHSDFECVEEDTVSEDCRKEDLPAEERIRLALDNLRADQPRPRHRQPSPLALEPSIEAAPLSPSLRQVAEPPRVQIIRHSAEEESLPESDILLEASEEPGLAHDQLELLSGERVRRYQHLPNPNLNARLNSLLLCALVFVVGLALGHFIGSTHERFSQHFQRVDCLDRIKSIQGELVRCAHKYDEMELQLNDVKATLVQKEYVDKWESLYQEGEEEKATLTETLNLYRSRYNKQQHELEERLDRLKSVQNELLRCTHRYEQLELKQNEVKATHVQKEYVDKWESLYQEGEEEKAAITATMNLYKTRYNKQKQLLTQCEVRFQDMQEQMGKLKVRKGRSLPLEDASPPCAAQRQCEGRLASLARRVSDLDSQLANCTSQLPRAGMLKNLLFLLTPLNASRTGDSWLWPRDLAYLYGHGDRLSNGTRELLARLQQHFNLTGNLTADWFNATLLSSNHSQRFAEWLSKMRESVDRFEVADLLRRASVAVADNVEQLFKLLSNAMKNVETNKKTEETDSEQLSLYQRLAERLKGLRAAYTAKKEEGVGGEIDKISEAWRKALSSTQAAWKVGVQHAKNVLTTLRRPGKPEVKPVVPEATLGRPGKPEMKPEVPEATLGRPGKPEMKPEAPDVTLGRSGKPVIKPKVPEVKENVWTTWRPPGKPEVEPEVPQGKKDVPAKRKLASVDPQPPQSQPDNSTREETPTWFVRRAEARKRLHKTKPDAEWYWRRKRDGRRRRERRGRVFERMSQAEPEEWPQAFWFMQRHMRRAQQRVWKSLSKLHERLVVHEWMLRRKRLREKARKKAERKRREGEFL